MHILDILNACFFIRQCSLVFDSCYCYVFDITKVIITRIIMTIIMVQLITSGIEKKKLSFKISQLLFFGQTGTDNKSSYKIDLLCFLILFIAWRRFISFLKWNFLTISFSFLQYNVSFCKKLHIF